MPLFSRLEVQAARRMLEECCQRCDVPFNIGNIQELHDTAMAAIDEAFIRGEYKLAISLVRIHTLFGITREEKQCLVMDGLRDVFERRELDVAHIMYDNFCWGAQGANIVAGWLYEAIRDAIFQAFLNDSPGEAARNAKQLWGFYFSIRSRDPVFDNAIREIEESRQTGKGEAEQFADEMIHDENFVITSSHPKVRAEEVRRRAAIMDFANFIQNAQVYTRSKL